MSAEFGIYLTTCTACGKRNYRNRDHAKRAARHDSLTGLRPYRCVETGTWHLGHLPPDVIAGNVTRDVIRESILAARRRRGT